MLSAPVLFSAQTDQDIYSTYLSIDNVKERFGKAITGFLNAKGLPGAVVSIYKSGELVMDESYGSNYDLSQVYPIASVSKLFTETAIQRLIAENVLSEDTKVLDYLKLDYPALDERVNNVTIQQLLDHKGGWDREITDDPLFSLDKLPGTIQSKEDLLKFVLTHYRLDHDPGQVESYSNFGYFLLGRVIEKATGQNYLDFVNKELAEPNHIELFQAVTPKEENSFKLELATASFGLSARISDVGYFFSKVDLNGFPKDTADNDDKDAMDWWKDGSLPGMVTSLVRHRQNDVVIAVFIPGRDEENWMNDNETLNKIVDATAQSVGL